MKRRRLKPDFVASVLTGLDEIINDVGHFKGEHDIMLIVVPRNAGSFNITYAGTAERAVAIAAMKYLLAKLEGQPLEVGHG